MIPELGHFLLILATLTALAAAPAVFAGLKRGNDFLRDFWRPALTVSLLGFAGASVCLVTAFLTDDFSVRYVADHSNTKLATVYKFAAFWGSHEGSMLLWVTLTVIAAAAAGLLAARDRQFIARTEAVMLGIVGAFGVFILTTSNPFLRNLPSFPVEGRDLNPVLQDIGMILHPPVLFAAYAGLALMFAMTAALLMGGRWSHDNIRTITKTSLAAWCFLTAGNMLGSWWAYNELGWGGWWFWDPVENASFIPWLTTTALLHALLQSERRAQLRRLAVLLTMSAFALSVLGTFLVRSGVMQSVHAFASDPTRGTALLILAAVFFMPALCLYIARIGDVCAETEAPLNADDALMTAAVFLMTAAGCCVLFGTLYPLIYEAFGGGLLTVGAPYFNQFFAPMTVIAALLIGALQARGAALWLQAAAALAAAGIAGGAALGLSPRDPLMTAAAVFAAFWILFTVPLNLTLKQRPHFSGAALLAHIGIAVSVFGAVGVEQFESEALTRMGPGLGRPLGDVIFVYTDTLPVSNHAYYAQQGRIEVLDGKDESLITVLSPERQTFRSNGMQMSAAGIDHGFFRDLYVSMGNKLSEEEWLVRLSIKPLASWIWGGGVLMIFGGLFGLSRRRKALRTAIADGENA